MIDTKVHVCSDVGKGASAVNSLTNSYTELDDTECNQFEYDDTLFTLCDF